MENGKSMLYRNKSEYLKQRKTASASKKKKWNEKYIDSNYSNLWDG